MVNGFFLVLKRAYHSADVEKQRKNLNNNNTWRKLTLTGT